MHIRQLKLILSEDEEKALKGEWSSRNPEKRAFGGVLNALAQDELKPHEEDKQSFGGMTPSALSDYLISNACPNQPNLEGVTEQFNKAGLDTFEILDKPLRDRINDQKPISYCESVYYKHPDTGRINHYVRLISTWDLSVLNIPGKMTIEYIVDDQEKTIELLTDNSPRFSCTLMKLIMLGQFAEWKQLLVKGKLPQAVVELSTLEEDIRGILSDPAFALAPLSREQLAAHTALNEIEGNLEGWLNALKDNKRKTPVSMKQQIKKLYGIRDQLLVRQREVVQTNYQNVLRAFTCRDSEDGHTSRTSAPWQKFFKVAAELMQATQLLLPKKFDSYLTTRVPPETRLDIDIPQMQCITEVLNRTAQIAEMLIKYDKAKEDKRALEKPFLKGELEVKLREYDALRKRISDVPWAREIVGKMAKFLSIAYSFLTLGAGYVLGGASLFKKGETMVREATVATKMKKLHKKMEKEMKVSRTETKIADEKESLVLASNLKKLHKR